MTFKGGTPGRPWVTVGGKMAEHRRRVLFATLAMVIGAGAMPGAARSQPHAECAVGEAALERTLAGQQAGPLIISAAPWPPMPVSSDVVFSGQPEAALPPALASAWNAGRPVNLFQACPALTKRLPPSWRYATAEEQAALQKPTIWNFGTPVVRGDYALVQIGAVCSGLCGSGRVELYRLEQGRWRFVAITAALLS